MPRPSKEPPSIDQSDELKERKLESEKSDEEPKPKRVKLEVPTLKRVKLAVSKDVNKMQIQLASMVKAGSLSENSEAEASDENEIEEVPASSNEEEMDSPAKDFKRSANIIFDDILSCLDEYIDLNADRMKTLQEAQQRNLADCNIDDKQEDREIIANMFKITSSACNRLQSVFIEMKNQLTVDQAALEEAEK